MGGRRWTALEEKPRSAARVPCVLRPASRRRWSAAPRRPSRRRGGAHRPGPPGTAPAPASSPGGEAGGARLAAVEIALDRGFKTYWRHPGEAGLPPAFDWSGSANLAAVEVLWPAPRRFQDAGGVSYGYEGGVGPAGARHAARGRPARAPCAQAGLRRLQGHLHPGPGRAWRWRSGGGQSVSLAGYRAGARAGAGTAGDRRGRRARHPRRSRPWSAPVSRASPCPCAPRRATRLSSSPRRRTAGSCRRPPASRAGRRRPAARRRRRSPSRWTSGQPMRRGRSRSGSRSRPAGGRSRREALSMRRRPVGGPAEARRRDGAALEVAGWRAPPFTIPETAS